MSRTENNEYKATKAEKTFDDNGDVVEVVVPITPATKLGKVFKGKNSDYNSKDAQKKAVRELQKKKNG